MALLNKEDGCVVLRIVYAGAPMSGKTESLRSLSGLLYGESRGEEEFYSPDHTDGRTLYFDWLNYTGGYYKGYKVNCQLISVPGQKTLKKRRKLLLEMADVVIFVVDSETGKLETALKYFEEMQPWLERKDEPPVGIVIQANKRDSETALPIPAIYETFQERTNLLVLESIAIKNSGIRETFVTGVRIGLERATWLIANEKMEIGKPELTGGDTLLNLIQAQEAADLIDLTHTSFNDTKLPTQSIRHIPELDLSSSHLHHIIRNEIGKKEGTTSEKASLISPPETTQTMVANETASSRPPIDQENGPSNDSATAENIGLIQTAQLIYATEIGVEASHPKQPNLPNKDVIAGSVYPPISGRIILHKLAEAQAELEFTENIGWEAKIGDQWRLLSREEDRFKSSNDARMKLVHYANSHKKHVSLLSEHRCMAIVESDDNDEWRVWQIVRNEATLEERLNHALMGNYPYKMAEDVFNIAENFVEAYKLFNSGVYGLPFHFNMIAVNQNKPVYTGYIPQQEIKAEPMPLIESVKGNFKPSISKALHDNPILSLGVPYVLSPLEGYGHRRVEMKPVIDVLRTLFIGEH